MNPTSIFGADTVLLSEEIEHNAASTRLPDISEEAIKGARETEIKMAPIQGAKLVELAEEGDDLLILPCSEVADIVGTVRSKIGGVESVFSATRLWGATLEEQKDVKKLQRIWDVEVIGKLRAFEKTGKIGYYKALKRQAFGILHVLSMALKDYIIKKAGTDWEINLCDVNTIQLLSPETIRSLMTITGEILQGGKSINDIEDILSKVVEDLTAPKKEAVF
jgi:hypothetical protein